MKISAAMALVAAAIFAVVCFGVAVKGFTSLGEMTDATQLADARGFAWFWTFLGSIGVVFGALSLWMIRTQKEPGDES